MTHLKLKVINICFLCVCIYEQCITKNSIYSKKKKPLRSTN